MQCQRREKEDKEKQLIKKAKLSEKANSKMFKLLNSKSNKSTFTKKFLLNIIEKGNVDLNVHDKDGKTTLIKAIKVNSLKIFNILHNGEASLTTPDKVSQEPWK